MNGNETSDPPTSMDPFDEKLSVLLQDVPVPEGLALRLVERLGREESSVRYRSPLRSHSTRFRFALGGVMAAAVMLFLAFWLSSPSANSVSEQFLLTEAIRRFESGFDRANATWTDSAASDDFPFSRVVVSVAGMRWRPVEDIVDMHGVVYELPDLEGANAALYVIRVETADELPSRPSRNPFSTAGCCASAWREDGLVYVLVVKGDASTYRTFLNLPQNPVAILWPARQSSPKPA